MLLAGQLNPGYQGQGHQMAQQMGGMSMNEQPFQGTGGMASSGGRPMPSY